MIQISYDKQSILDALTKLQQTSHDLSPALKEIGEDLAESTQERFEDSQGPDGKRWQANSEITARRKSGNKPLIGETGLLGLTINYEVDGQVLAIGSPMQYAAMQQFGGTKAEFPWLWGDIPARPFLGISNDDERSILEVVNRYLEDGLK